MWYLSEIYVQFLLDIQSGGLGNTRVIHSLREFLLPIFHDTHTHMCARIMAHGILIKENSPPSKRQMCFSTVIEKVSSSLQHETLHHPSFHHQPMQYADLFDIFRNQTWLLLGLTRLCCQKKGKVRLISLKNAHSQETLCHFHLVHNQPCDMCSGCNEKFSQI